MAGTLPRFAQALGDGIWCIDTGYHRPRYDAAYLLVDNGRAAFFDTGTNVAVPRLLAGRRGQSALVQCAYRLKAWSAMAKPLALATASWGRRVLSV